MISKVGINVLLNSIFFSQNWEMCQTLLIINDIINAEFRADLHSDLISSYFTSLDEKLEYLPQAVILSWPLLFVPKDSALPSAPPSSPGRLNSVGNPPGALCCFGHFSSPIWRAAVRSVVSGAKRLVSRTERWVETMGVESCFSSWLGTALTPCCC